MARLQRELVLKIMSDIGGANAAEKAIDRVTQKATTFAQEQLRLAQSSQQVNQQMLNMSRHTETALRALDRFNPRISRMAYGMHTLVGKISAVNTSLAALGATYMGQKATQIYKAGMDFNENMESSVARTSSEIRQEKESLQSAMRRAQAQTKWVQNYQRSEGRIYSQDELQHTLADMAVLYRGDIAKAQRATRTAALLAAKNPHQGLMGAKIAIQEAESGVWTSASRRFFLPKNVLEQYKEQGGLAAIENTLKDIKVTPELLERMGDTVQGMKGQIKGIYQQMFGQLTKGIFDAKREHMMFVRDQLAGLTAEKGAFTQIGGVLSDIGGKLGKMFYKTMEFPVRNADKILKFLKNLKTALDPMMAVLKAFGKGLYQGFVGPLNMIMGQMKFMGGTAGKFASIMSKLIGIGGKGMTSPLYLLAPLAKMMGTGLGAKFGAGLTNKAWQYVGGFSGIRHGISQASPHLKGLWSRMGQPLFAADGTMIVPPTGGNGGHGITGGHAGGGASPATVAAAASVVSELATGSGGGRLFQILEEIGNIAGMASPAGFLSKLVGGGMGDGGIAQVIENQFVGRLGFIDDIATGLGNVSTAFSEMMQGMNGVVSPMNALAAAVSLTVAPFTVLAKVLRVVTAPFNTAAGGAVMRGVGKVAAPMLWPAMFAMGTAGSVSVMKQFSGMAMEGTGAFGKGWTGRIGRAFLHGTDFAEGSAGASGAGMFGGLLGQGIGLGRGLVGRLPAWAQGPLNAYLGMLGNGGGGLHAGVGTLSSTADFILNRFPQYRAKALGGAHRGINGMLGQQRNRIAGMKAQLAHMAANGAPAHQMRSLQQEIMMAEAGLSEAQGHIGANGMPTSLAGANAMRESLSKAFGRQPIKETLQDTLERLLTQTPEWFNTLPIWFTHKPYWMGGGPIPGASPSGGGGPHSPSSGGGLILPPGFDRGSHTPSPLDDIGRRLGLPPGTPPTPDGVRDAMRDRLIHKLTGITTDAAKKAGILDADGKFKSINTAGARVFGAEMLAGGKALGAGGMRWAGTAFNTAKTLGSGLLGTGGSALSAGAGLLSKTAIAGLFPTFLPLLLGSGAIATFTALAKHIGRRLGGFNLSGAASTLAGIPLALRSGLGSGVGFLQDKANRVANFMPMMGRVGGGIVGGAIGLRLAQALGAKNPILAALLGGLGGSWLGNKFGQGQANSARRFFDPNIRHTKWTDWVTGGTMIPMALGSAMMLGSRYMKKGVARNIIGHAGGIMSGNWMGKIAGWVIKGLGHAAGKNTLIGKTLIGLGENGLFGGLGKASGKAGGRGFSGLLTYLMGVEAKGGKWSSAAGKGIDALVKGRLGFEDAKGFLGRFLPKSSVVPKIPRGPFNLVQGLADVASVGIKGGAAVLKGGANLTRWGLTTVLPKTLSYLTGRSGLLLKNSWKELPLLGKIARAGRVGVGLAGLYALASHFGLGNAGASGVGGHGATKPGLLQSGGSLISSFFNNPLLLAGTLASPLLAKAGIFGKLAGAGKMGRFALGAGKLFGASAGTAALLGGSAAGAMSLPGLNLMLTAGLSGWGIGKMLGKAKIGGKSINSRVEGFFAKNIYGVGGDPVSVQVKTMIDTMRQSASKGVTQVKAVATNVAKSITDSLSGLWDTAQNWLYKISNGKLGKPSTPTTPTTPPGTPTLPPTAPPGPVPLGPPVPNKPGALAGKGIDSLIYGIGRAEGWGLKPDGKGGWLMDKRNAKTRAPFGLLGDLKAHPELGTNANLLHDFMIGKMTGKVLPSVAKMGVKGFGSTVIPGLLDGSGNLTADGLQKLQEKWAPIGAKNDPHNLNANWLGNVTRLSQQMPTAQIAALPSVPQAPQIGPPVPGGAGNSQAAPAVHVNLTVNNTTDTNAIGDAVKRHVVNTLRTPDAKKALLGQH